MVFVQWFCGGFSNFQVRRISPFSTKTRACLYKTYHSHIHTFVFSACKNGYSKWWLCMLLECEKLWIDSKETDLKGMVATTVTRRPLEHALNIKPINGFHCWAKLKLVSFISLPLSPRKGLKFCFKNTIGKCFL